MNSSVHTQAGALLIIGGNEDREHDMAVRDRFVEWSGGRDSNIVVVTAASDIGDEVFGQYRVAFRALRVKNLAHVHLNSPKEGGSDKQLAPLPHAHGIFMTGGDQKRLLEMIGRTPVQDAMRDAWARGACLAGTSAGASAMSALMLAQGSNEPQPEKGAVRLDSGLGFVRGIVVDQHFAQRQRLPRLLSVVAEHPDVYGIGVDEDTALVMDPMRGVEVIGSGSVTVLDAMSALSNIAEIDKHAVPRLIPCS